MRNEKFLKSKRGMVGIEAAIVLIAFVIVAAAFSFMVVNMGLYATQRGRDVIQQGIQESSSPLTLDGSVMIKTTSEGGNVSAIIIPIKTMGNKWVAMWENGTVVSLMVGQKAWANIYRGIPSDDVNEKIGVGDGSKTVFSGTLKYSPVVNKTLIITDGVETFTDLDGDGNLEGDKGGTGTITYDTGVYSVTFNTAPANGEDITAEYRTRGFDPTGLTYDVLISNVIEYSGRETSAVLLIENNNGDDALQYYEKGFLIIVFASGNEALPREELVIEIRPEKGTPLTIEFVIPEALPADSYILVG